MNSLITVFVAVLVVLVGFANTAGANDASAVRSHAQLARETAEKIALTKVPGGVIKSAELEKEHGKLVWSFDIATQSSPNITEVQVDAKTGDIVSVEIETPADQKRESAADAAGKKSGKK